MISDTKSVANFFYCLKCSETSEPDHKVSRKKEVQAAKSSQEGVGV